ncbi:MAG TPA: site-2 protease family protein [bacterium]|nr:site-2 protease family protein [bacterium]
MMLQLLLQEPIVFFLLAGALIVSISIHEFSHAFVANALGDSTAKKGGRLTLNPKAHLDPIGMLFLLLLGFGWGKPVPFDPNNLKNPRRDSALVSLAGPASNLILAVIISLILKLAKADNIFGLFLYMTAFYNLILGFFNLIPLGPLDGNKIVFGFLPGRLAIQWMEFQKYGTYILLFLIIFNFTEKIVQPLVDLAMKILGLYLP